MSARKSHATDSGVFRQLWNVQEAQRHDMLIQKTELSASDVSNNLVTRAMETIKEHSTNEIAAIVRKALTNRYGRKSVSVTKGRGTAGGWIHATIETKKPHDCFCKKGETYCQRCVERIKETSKEARKIAYDAIEKKGAKFMTYCADDGFNTDRDCFMLQTRLII